MVEIQGFCKAEFQPVQAAFEWGFSQGLEQGASVAVTHNNELVVDLWAGFADARGEKSWNSDTVVNVASTTKIMVTLCALMLVDQGKLALDERVIHYWPEFGRHGKEEVTVRQIFSHSSGVPGWRPAIPFSTILNWEDAIRSLEDQELWWKPGTQTGYHSSSFGFLLGELVRRVSGLKPGQYLKREVTSKIGADFQIGFPQSDFPRMARLIEEEDDSRFSSEIAEQVANCLLPPAWDSAACLTEEIPHANGMGNGRSIAQILAIFANGGEVNGHRFLSEDTLVQALTEQSYRQDLVVGMPVRFGLGFGLNSKEFPCPSDRALHWGGKGGSFCIADLESRTSIGYAPSHWLPGILNDPRDEKLIEGYFASVS